MSFRCILIISPLKMVWSFIWKNLNPLHPRMLCAKFGEIGQVVLEKMKIWKVYDNDDDDNGDGQILISKAHLILRLRWAKRGTCIRHCIFTFLFVCYFKNGYSKGQLGVLFHLFFILKMFHSFFSHKKFGVISIQLPREPFSKAILIVSCRFFV